MAAFTSISVTKTKCLFKNLAFDTLPCVVVTRRAPATILAFSALFAGCMNQSQQGSYAAA